MRQGEEWEVSRGRVSVAGGAYPKMRVTLRCPKSGFTPNEAIDALESLERALDEAAGYWIQYQPKPEMVEEKR